MRKVIAAVFILSMFLLQTVANAELKSSDVGIVPKLTEEEMEDAPELYNSIVYPSFGTPCTNFTYIVKYRDSQGRSPSYIRIWLNGEWHDMEKVKGDYTSGAMYAYSYVPTSGKELFYYFEASNGAGKARAGIIDSPDQGPVLYAEKLDNNQVILLDSDGNELWTYETGNDWVEGVAISDGGEYITASAGRYIYLFSKDSGDPLWSFCENCGESSAIFTNAAGVDISADGEYVAGSLGDSLFFFDRESNTPLWQANIECNAIGIAVSEHGEYIAVGGSNKVFFFDKAGTKLWEYQPSHPDYEQTGNFYRPAMTPDGSYTAVSTGCPDRRAYLFSNDGTMLFRTEQLTEDSPVHKSAISNDGNHIAYSFDHSQGSTIVTLFDKSGNELWSFSSQSDSTARAVSISEDGNYVAGGTTAGNIYLFSRTSNVPLWSFSEGGSFSHIGEVKLNSDGSLLAAGGAAKKVYMFSRDSNTPLWEYDAVTYVTFIDFNGEYVVAGTGAREFMFEGNSASREEVECTEITNPTPYWEIEMSGDAGVSDEPGVCGDGICEDMKGETYENCPQDCMMDGDSDMDEIPDGSGNGFEPEDVHIDGILPVLIVVIVAVAGVLLFLKFRK